MVGRRGADGEGLVQGTFVRFPLKKENPLGIWYLHLREIQHKVQTYI